MTDYAKLKVGKSELLCKNGCGFFGNPEWNWYCSQCWRKHNSKEMSYSFDASPAPPQNPGAGVTAFSQSYSPSPPSFSQSLPSPLNKTKSSGGLASMIGRSPGLDRKLKLPSPQHVAKEISDKVSMTKKLNSQTLDRSASNIRQIFKKGTIKKDESKSERNEPPPEAKTISKEFGDFLTAIHVKKSGIYDLSKNIQSLVDKVHKRVEILPVDEVAAMIQHFYQALEKRLESHENFAGISYDDLKKICDYTERYVMVCCYKQLFCPFSTTDEEKDLEIQSKIRSLNWVTASHLECPFRETDPAIRDHIYTAINHVLEVDGMKAPQDKLASIVNCAKIIFTLLGQGGGAPASADDFLPCLIYILLKANPPRIQSNINFITRFTNEQRLRSGEEGYYFTNLCCALSFVENISAASLNLPEAEFQSYISGESIPPGSWETGLLMCEGIQTMSHNLKTLSELTELQTRLLAEAESLEKEMETWGLGITTEVEAVLARTRFEIRGPKKPAAVDSSLDLEDGDTSLPPPLIPDQAAAPAAGGGGGPDLDILGLGNVPPPPSSSSSSSSSFPGTFLDRRTANSPDPTTNSAPPPNLIDNTPTEELLPCPLLPLSSLTEAAGPPSVASTTEKNVDVEEEEEVKEEDDEIFDDAVSSEAHPTGLAEAVTTSSAAGGERPPSLSSYVGFSVQAVSIPSISCITADSPLPPTGGLVVPLSASSSPVHRVDQQQASEAANRAEPSQEEHPPPATQVEKEEDPTTSDMSS